MDDVTNVRVVRGPDWCSGSVDGGDGHLGTVVEVKPTADGAHEVVVQWDNGNRNEYRYGSEGNYTLRIYDNAPAVVIFTDISCDGCKANPIYGMRFHCNKCFDINLCLPCYNAGKHDVGHDFSRVDYTDGAETKLPPRKNAWKSPAKGLLAGATVERGQDWEWEDQDGGPGKTGKVIEVKGWNDTVDGNGLRDAACVRWDYGLQNIYRVGPEGKVDLKCTVAAEGGNYYPDHLPLLGASYQAFSKKFEEGTMVKVGVEVEQFEKMQEGHGGWEDDMSQILEIFGMVVAILGNGDLRVHFVDNKVRTINPSCMTKVPIYSEGDKVIVINEEAKVRQLQKGHGGWVDDMASSLGCVGKVIEVFSDADVKIQVVGRQWSLNPYCIQPAPDDVLSPTRILEGPGIRDNLEHYMMVAAASTGDVQTVQNKLQANPSLINVVVMEKTMMHCAVAADNTEMVKLLLKFKPDLEIGDENGDKPLHHCAFEGRHKLAKFLVLAAANVNSKNKKGQTPLMIAACGEINVLKLLTSDPKIEVDLQDLMGNSALNWAVIREQEEAVKMLLDAKANPALADNKTFAPIHMAATKGFTVAMKEFCTRFPQHINLTKKDGFTALHLAACNDRLDVIRLLGKEARCDLNAMTTDGQTALHLAISKFHYRIVDRLVGYGAEMNVQNALGETPLHLILSEMTIVVLRRTADMPEMMKVRDEYKIPLGSGRAVVACFLVQEGADVSICDKKGNTPLHKCTPAIAQFVNTAAQKKRPQMGYRGSLLQKRPKRAYSGAFGEKLTIKKGVEISFSDLTFGDPIGSGGYGQVYRGRWDSKRMDVAIKMLSGRIRKEEVELLSQIDHPNIIDYYGEASGDHKYAIITEFVRGGSLHHLLHKELVRVGHELSVQWSMEIADGMAYLHHLKIIHRDLKPLNILLTEEMVTKIIDFGEAKEFEETKVQTSVGTTPYMAPEILHGKPYSLSSDVYSYGMVLYEIFTFNMPYQGMTTFQIQMKKVTSEVPTIPKSCNADIADLMQKCWKINAKERPTFPTILSILGAGESKEQEEPDATDDIILKKQQAAVPGTGEGKPLTLVDLPILQTKLKSIEALWFPLGMALKIDANTLGGIPGIAGSESSGCLSMMLVQWLQTKEYTPTMEYLADCIRSNASIPDGEEIAASLKE